MTDSAPKSWNTIYLWITRALVHLLGVVFVAALGAAPFVNGATIEAIGVAAHGGAWGVLSLPYVTLHVGLAACAWALFCITYHLAQERLSKPRRVSLKMARGNVMIETLVILPVLLLFIFGLAQLAINNMAGILSNLATFQAARAAWVWEREPCTGPACNVQDRARIQAALILAPVAPGDFSSSMQGESTAMRQMRGAIVGAQIPSGASDSGYAGIAKANTIMSGATDDYQSFVGALDTSSFVERSARKFSFAYQATSISVSASGETLTMDMTYQHYVAFPMVGVVFGEQRNVAGRAGYYTTIQRQYRQLRLPAPNRRAPIQTTTGPRFF